jgi:hypothetical protein
MPVNRGGSDAALRRAEAATAKMLQLALKDPENADLWMLHERGLPKERKRHTAKEQIALVERLTAKPEVEEPLLESLDTESVVLRPVNRDRLKELAVPKSLVLKHSEVRALAEAEKAEKQKAEAALREKTKAEAQLSAAESQRRVAVPRCAPAPTYGRDVDSTQPALELLRARSEIPVMSASGGIVVAEVVAPRAERVEPLVMPPEKEVLDAAEEVLYILIRLVKAMPQELKQRVGEFFSAGAEGAFPAPRFLQHLPTWQQAQAEPAVLRVVGRSASAGNLARLQAFRDELLNSRLTHIAAETL